MENLLWVHTDHFNNIPILEQITMLSAPPNVPGFSHRICDLETKFGTLEQLVTKDIDIHFTESISTMQEEICLLQQRILGSGVTIGSHFFQSYEDLVIWTKTNLPSGRFGLFVDGHSLLDFFSFVGFFGRRVRREQLSQLEQVQLQIHAGDTSCCLHAELLPSSFRQGGWGKD
jgi:hypothetical protein